MTTNYLPIDKILAILKESSPRLANLTSGLSRDQLHTAPDAGEWSINEALAHLRACGDEINTWIYDINHERSVHQVLDESHQVLQHLLALAKELLDDIKN